MILGSQVDVYGYARDVYGRLVADVYCAGSWVNEEMRNYLGQ